MLTRTINRTDKPSPGKIKGGSKREVQRSGYDPVSYLICVCNSVKGRGQSLSLLTNLRPEIYQTHLQNLRARSNGYSSARLSD